MGASYGLVEVAWEMRMRPRALVIVPASVQAQKRSQTNLPSMKCVANLFCLPARKSLDFFSFLQRSPSPLSNAPKPKGKRAMDAFLEEIKRCP